MVEILTLILDDNHFEADKEKLKSKSRYFESLLSGNFSDSHKTEHTINYDVSPCTFKNFLEWIHDDEECEDNCHSIKHSMMKFTENNFPGLLNLLQLSVLFTVDGLTNDIMDIIVLFWLSRKYVIRIWLLAKELGVKVLRDICFSVCLDSFEQLPLHSLVELNRDNIASLLQNVNVKASNEYLRLVRYEWMVHNKTSDVLAVGDGGQPKLIKGTVVYVKDEGIITDGHLYTWNGTNFSKEAQLTNIQQSQKGIIGMQVIGRGFSIYTVGGEMGLGTGKFNRSIMRYCLLSKKWYHWATLPMSRRHMVVEFIKNKLILVGGVGKYRLKLVSVDILDIHTGMWSKGAVVPESFALVPAHCVMEGKLLLIKSALYIYDPERDHWETVDLCPDLCWLNWDVCLSDSATLFRIGKHQGKTVLSRIDVMKEPNCEKVDCLKQYLEHKVVKPQRVHKYASYRSRYIILGGIHMGLLNDIRDERCLYLHIHTDLREEFGDADILPVECFKFIDPTTLYNTA